MLAKWRSNPALNGSRPPALVLEMRFPPLLSPRLECTGTQLDPPGGVGVLSVVDELTPPAGRSFQAWMDLRFKADTEWAGLIFGYDGPNTDHFSVQWSDGKYRCRAKWSFRSAHGPGQRHRAG